VADRVSHVRTLYWAAQDLNEAVGLADRVVARGRSPGFELTPRLFRRRGGLIPDAAICHDARKLITTGSGNLPTPVSFSQTAQECIGSFMLIGFPAMGVDEQVRVDRNHCDSGSP
jgi:hypothetical protein